MGRPGSGALPPLTVRPLGGLPGPSTHWLWVRGGAGVGTRHQPHIARSCVLWGRHEGAQGGRLLPGCGASGVARSPTPNCPPSGRAAGAHHPLAVGAGGCGLGDPSPTPQRALLRAGFARCGGGMRVPGGGASCLGVGRPGSGALPPPTARPLGGLPGPTTHWLWVRGGADVGTRHQPHSARSCVLWGRHESTHVMSYHGALEPSSAGPPSGRPSAERLAVTHTRTPMEWAPGEGGPRAPCMARRREAPGPSKVHHGQASGRSETPVPPTGPSFLGTGGSHLRRSTRALEAHLVRQWCVCPSQAAPLTPGGARGGWRHRRPA